MIKPADLGLAADVLKALRAHENIAEYLRRDDGALEVRISWLDKSIAETHGLYIPSAILKPLVDAKVAELRKTLRDMGVDA